MAGTYIISGTVENAERYRATLRAGRRMGSGEEQRCSPSIRARVGSLGVFAFFVKRAGTPIPAGVQRHERQARPMTRASRPGSPADEHDRIVPVVVNGVSAAGDGDASLRRRAAMLRCLRALDGRARVPWDANDCGSGDGMERTDRAGRRPGRPRRPRGSRPCAASRASGSRRAFRRETGIGIYPRALRPASDPGPSSSTARRDRPRTRRDVLLGPRPHEVPGLVLPLPVGPPPPRAWELAQLGHRGVLHGRLGFRRLDVVRPTAWEASVSRSFIATNVLDHGNTCAQEFVSISTPWGGHEAASMGVKFRPAVVLSWRDMVTGSDFRRPSSPGRSRAGSITS